MTTEASQSQWPSMEEPEKGESPTNLSVETASVGSVDSVTPSPTPQPVQTQKVGTAEACNLIELAIKVIVDVEQCHPCCLYQEKRKSLLYIFIQMEKDDLK